MNLIAITSILMCIFCCLIMAVSGWACWKDTNNAFFLMGGVFYGIATVALISMLLFGG